MGLLAKLLAPLVPTLLNWLGGKLFSFGEWAYSKMYNYKVNRGQINDIKDKRDRYNAADAAAYDGLPVTPEQKEELRNAARDLIRAYEYRRG